MTCTPFESHVVVVLWYGPLAVLMVVLMLGCVCMYVCARTVTVPYVPIRPSRL